MPPVENASPEQQKAFSILDGTLDDIEDLPQFLAFPSGAYIVNLPDGLQEKMIGAHPAVDMKVKCMKVEELSNPEDAALAPKVGDQGNMAFMLDNETGRGFLKMVLKSIGERLNVKGNREIMAASKGITALLVVKKTHDSAKQRDYMNLVKFAVV
jgi:hypothetical protein